MATTRSKIRRSIQVEERRARVAELTLQGKTEREIAQIVGVGPSQVHRDIEACRVQWRHRSMEAVEAVQAELLAHHRRNYLILLADYEASKAPKITIRREYEEKAPECAKSGSGQGALNEKQPGALPRSLKTVNIVETTAPGIPQTSLMAEAGACLDRIAKLMGAYKPTAVVSTRIETKGSAEHPSSVNYIYIDMNKSPSLMSDEELERTWKSLNDPSLRTQCSELLEKNTSESFSEQPKITESQSMLSEAAGELNG